VHRALASAVSDIEERARHLALAADGPDGVAASYLEAAAEHAAGRGATSAAAELAYLAAQLTPDDPALVRRRRLRSASLHRLAGEGERTAAILEGLLGQAPPGTERADVLFELALTYRADLRKTIELCNQALAEAAGDNVRSTRILAFRSLYRLLEVNVSASLSDAHAALEKAEQVGDPVLLAATIARVGHAETYTTEITQGLLERGVEMEDRLELELEHQNSPRFHLGRLLLRLGEVDRARAMLEQAEAAASARGDEINRMVGLWYLSILEWFAGRWQRALDYALAAREAGEQTQFPHTPGWVGRVQALVDVDLGLVEQARAAAEEGLAFSRAIGNESFSLLNLAVLGRLELALGNVEAAGRYLRELPGRFLAGGWNDPTQPMWADAIETLVGLGELERARAYLDPYELHAQRLGSPLARAGAARSSALLAAAEGDLPTALAALESSLADAQPFPLERGRTLLCLGVVRRQAQQKKAAREALEQALAIFDELGARLWAEKARAELRRISGRAPSSAELTETEQRVAGLAAQGRSNREIAAELFMGVSTVEAHLSRVYRKLGIRSRAGLAGRLGTPVDTAAEV
jgi:DNA-binding CsgD family transcriptional regulator